MHEKNVNIFKNIKLENFNSIGTFFRVLKIRYFSYTLAWPDSLKIVLSGRIRRLIKNIESTRILR